MSKKTASFKFKADLLGLAKVEKSLCFLADDYNIWSWDGVQTTKLSHLEKLEDFVNKHIPFGLT